MGLIKVLLRRHPPKDRDGDVTEEGLQALHDQLVKEWRSGEFTSLRLFVSGHKRGEQCIPALQRFAQTIGVDCEVKTNPHLVGLMNHIDGDVMGDFLRERLGSGYTEAAATSLLVEEHFEQLLPGALFTGRDHALEVNKFIRAIAANRPADERPLVVAISHSGVIEYLLKLYYLACRTWIPDQTKVGVEEIGGLVDFCGGPTIMINYLDAGIIASIPSGNHLWWSHIKLD